MKRNLFVILLTIGIGAAYAQSISPYLFGQNHWLAQGDEDRVGYMHLLWPKVQESGVKVVRIGGNGYNRNLPERKRLAAMVDSIRHIGAEPLLQVPCDYTALQAMELVEYFTQRGEKKVRFWCIGNEPLLRNEFTIEGVRDYILRLAPAMKRVDPTIKILVFDECELREAAYRDLCGGRLDITGLQENGAWLIDGFTFHKYPNGREFNRDHVVFSGPETIRNQAEKLVRMMNEADKKHRRSGEAKLMWALTEVNVTYANPDREIAGFGNTSFLGGQFMAEIFGFGMQYGAFTVNPWCISETDAVSTDFGYLGLPREFYPRSSYYHMQMMAENMKGQFIKTSDNQSYVKTIGSRSPDQICVMVMNEHQTLDFSFDILLNMDNTSAKSLCINADASLAKTLCGVIGNQTTMLFIFSADGDLKKQVMYGLRHNLRYQAPEVKGAPFKDAEMGSVPQNIPGKIQCEYYDWGGEGVAFHDNDAINSGSGGLNPADGSYLNEFRKNEGVDISYTKIDEREIDNNPYNKVEPMKDQLYVGWTEPGEWLTYTVAVHKSSLYQVGLMYTSNRGGAISLSIDGKDGTGPIAIPSTFIEAEPIAWRQWHHWNYIDDLIKINLKEGEQVLTLSVLTQGNMNFDYLEFKSIE